MTAAPPKRPNAEADQMSPSAEAAAAHASPEHTVARSDTPFALNTLELPASHKESEASKNPHPKPIGDATLYFRVAAILGMTRDEVASQVESLEQYNRLSSLFKSIDQEVQEAEKNVRKVARDVHAQRIKNGIYQVEDLVPVNPGDLTVGYLDPPIKPAFREQFITREIRDNRRFIVTINPGDSAMMDAAQRIRFDLIDYGAAELRSLLGSFARERR